MSLLINIAATFSGKKALKEAQKQVNVLESSVKKLGATLGVSLSAAAVVAFGKASVKAFAEDEKAATRLAGVLENLGLAFANPQIAAFIEDLSKATGVVDDDLRPAMQSLITTTGSLANSQKLLAQAIDISAASGVDLVTVSNDLAQAYVGNTRGLRKYNLGLTQAELKAASFAEIQQRLTTLFSGANAKYLETYAGKMQLLTTSANEAKEVIGAGLVDALTIVAGKDRDIQDLADSMANVATQISNVTRGVGLMIAEFKKIPGAGLLGDAFSAAVKSSGLGALIGLAARKGATKQSTGFSFFGSPMETTQNARNAAAAKKAEAEAAKRAKAIVDAQKKNTAELKKQSLAKKQSALFDLEQIQIIAALKGKISEEDKLRLKLQLALLTENESEAAKLSKQLAMSIDSTGKLAEYLTTLPDAKNPFKGWDEWLKSFKSNLSTVTGGVMTDASSFAGVVPSTNVAPVTDPNAVTGFAPGGVTTAGGQVIKVDLNVDGKTLASVLQDASLSGNQVYVDRLTGRFYQ
jgi:hypothetical protein